MNTFQYKGHEIELRHTWGHQYSIFIDGCWAGSCTNFSEDGTRTSVEVYARQLIDKPSRQ
jgi:hypothetical protein